MRKAAGRLAVGLRELNNASGLDSLLDAINGEPEVKPYGDIENMAAFRRIMAGSHGDDKDNALFVIDADDDD